MTDQKQENLTAAKSFVRAVETMDGSCLDVFFSRSVSQTEWPNLFKPQGEHRDLDQLKSDIEKARGVLREQRYDITRELAGDDCVILEMVWHGIMEKDLPPPNGSATNNMRRGRMGKRKRGPQPQVPPQANQEP